MIELNSVFVVLMAEVFFGLVIFVLVFLLFSRKKSSNEQAVANELIDKLEDTENIRAKQLGEMITEHCNTNPDEIKELLNEISSSERALYQQMIQMFLNRDVAVLNEMDHYIDQISEPYCKIIRHSSGGDEESGKLDVAEQKIQKLIQQSERLGEQLTEAMNTMDEISAEYTRVFSGTQTELELENSSKKMFNIFHDAEQRIRDLSKDKEAEQL